MVSIIATAHSSHRRLLGSGLDALAPADRALLEKARDGYRGTVADAWDNETDHVSALAHELAERARREA